MSTRYLCQSWQSLVQMTVYLVSRGYRHYCVTMLPAEKIDRWTDIDQKLMTRYHINLSKWQKARRKRQGFANFAYLRWDRLSIILHTAGEMEFVKVEDNFLDIYRTPISLPISPLICMSISMEQLENQNRTTVRLNRESYRGFKDYLYGIVKAGNINQILKEYDKINGLPCYRGIINQKKQLVKYVESEAKRRQLPLQASNLRLNTYLKRYPVFVVPPD